MDTENEKMMEAHHKINGVATDILTNAELLIESEKDFEFYAQMLSDNCDISLEESKELLKLHL